MNKATQIGVHFLLLWGTAGVLHLIDRPIPQFLASLTRPLLGLVFAVTATAILHGWPGLALTLLIIAAAILYPDIEGIVHYGIAATIGAATGQLVRAALQRIWSKQ